MKKDIFSLPGGFPKELLEKQELRFIREQRLEEACLLTMVQG